MTGTYEGGRVLGGSAHLLSHALVMQSASVTYCALSLSACLCLCATPAVVSAGQEL